LTIISIFYSVLGLDVWEPPKSFHFWILNFASGRNFC
jgi:hypothetical protein